MSRKRKGFGLAGLFGLGEVSLDQEWLSAGRPVGPRLGEVGRRDPQVVPEGPVDESLDAAEPDHQSLDARPGPREQLLRAQHPAELPLVRVVEPRVPGGRGLARLPALDDSAQLPAQFDPEIERRADPLRGQRQAVPGRVAGEEDAVLGRRAQLVGDPVALVSFGSVPRSSVRRTVVSLT